MNKTTQTKLANQIAKIRNAVLLNRGHIPSDMFACMIDMSYLCWQRLNDIRLLKETQISDKHVTFEISKAIQLIQPIQIYISEEIRSVINNAQEIKRNNTIISKYLFADEDGQPYSDVDLRAIWARAKARAEIKDEVSFFNIRALSLDSVSTMGETRPDTERRVYQDSSKVAPKLPW